MPQPADVERLARQLIALYRDAQLNIEQQLARLAVSDSPSRRRRRLRELERTINAEMRQLQSATREWLEGGFSDIYTLGARDGAASIGDSFIWTQPHRQAVQHLAGDLFDDVLTATRHVADDAKAYVRTAARKQTTLALIEGRTAVQAARDFRRQAAGEIADELGGPLGMVRYADGSLRRLDDYADMLLRTKTAQAYNAGTLNQLTGSGVEWVEVFDGANCGWSSHDDGDTANGSVRSIEDAMQHPLSHPRCRRSFGGRLDVKSAKQAKAAKPTTTAAQRVDQAQAERDRAQALSDARRRRTNRSARVPRGTRQPRVPRAEARARQLPAQPRRPSASLRFDDAEATRRFSGLAQSVDGLHSFPADGFPVTRVTFEGRSYNGLGGEFYPGLLRIKVYDRADKTDPLSFLHEFGHRLDFGSNGFVTRGNVPDAEVGRALRGFLTAAGKTDTIRLAGPRMGTPAKIDYFLDPAEIWARAYSQWAAGQIGGDARVALRAMNKRYPRYQWPDGEFSTIAPTIEELLRARGLL